MLGWASKEYGRFQGVIYGVSFILVCLGIYLWPDAEIQGSTFKFLSVVFGLMLLTGFIGLFVLAVRAIHTRKYVNLGIRPLEERQGIIYGTTILDDELEIIVRSENQSVEINSPKDGRKLVVCIGYDSEKEQYFLIVEDKELFDEEKSRKYFDQIGTLKREMRRRTHLVPELFVER